MTDNSASGDAPVAVRPAEERSQDEKAVRSYPPTPRARASTPPPRAQEAASREGVGPGAATSACANATARLAAQAPMWVTWTWASARVHVQPARRRPGRRHAHLLRRQLPAAGTSECERGLVRRMARAPMWVTWAWVYPAPMCSPRAVCLAARRRRRDTPTARPRKQVLPMSRAKPGVALHRCLPKRRLGTRGGVRRQLRAVRGILGN